MPSTASQKNFEMRTNLSILLGAVALSFVATEVCLRGLGWFGTPGVPPKCVYWDEDICAMYQEHNPHGYRLWPSRSSQYLYPEEHPRRLTVTSNKYGFRSERQLSEPDGRIRVLVLGDSMVLGEGVEEHERFTDVLETMEPMWRVDNLGMTGYGADLMIMALEKVGLNLKPDFVVLSMYTHDFRRVHPLWAGVGFTIPRFKLVDGELVVTPYPKLNFLQRTRIYQAIARLYWDYSKAEWQLNEAILDRFLKLGEVHGFAPAIIFLPGRRDSETDKQRRYWLWDYAQKNQTPFLDLSDPIHNADVKRVFIPSNPHLNPEGHMIVAYQLHGFLVEQLGTSRRLKVRHH